MRRRTSVDALGFLGACDESIEWVQTTKGDPRQLWYDCQRGDWLLWLAVRVGVDRRATLAAALECVRPVLWCMPQEAALVCLWAMDAAERWMMWQSHCEEIRAAVSALREARNTHTYAVENAVGFLLERDATASADMAARALLVSIPNTKEPDIIRDHISWAAVERSIKLATS